MLLKKVNCTNYKSLFNISEQLNTAYIVKTRHVNMEIHLTLMDKFRIYKTKLCKKSNYD